MSKQHRNYIKLHKKNQVNNRAKKSIRKFSIHKEYEKLNKLDNVARDIGAKLQTFFHVIYKYFVGYH